MSTLAKLLLGAGGASTEPVPTEPGTPYGGGFYAGKIMVDEQAYALVVAPKSQGGESASLRLKQQTSNTVGTDSRSDGWSNTQAMIQAGIAVHHAAAFCVNLDINGYDDWYLPSQDELEILYRAFKPTTGSNNTAFGTNPSAIPPTGNYTTSNPSQTNVNVFKLAGGEDFIANFYWSSTHGASGAGTGWTKRFSDGFQSAYYKNSTYQVRAVRRVAIEE